MSPYIWYEGRESTDPTDPEAEWEWSPEQSFWRPDAETDPNVDLQISLVHAGIGFNAVAFRSVFLRSAPSSFRNGVLDRAHFGDAISGRVNMSPPGLTTTRTKIWSGWWNDAPQIVKDNFSHQNVYRTDDEGFVTDPTSPFINQWVPFGSGVLEDETTEGGSCSLMLMGLVDWDYIEDGGHHIPQWDLISLSGISADNSGEVHWRGASTLIDDYLSNRNNVQQFGFLVAPPGLSSVVQSPGSLGSLWGRASESGSWEGPVFTGTVTHWSLSWGNVGLGLGDLKFAETGEMFGRGLQHRVAVPAD